MFGYGSHAEVCAHSINFGRLESFTWTSKACGLMAFWDIFRGFGPLFYLFWGIGPAKP